MNIFITGSAGFLGKTLVRLLSENGHVVTGIDLKSQTTQGHTAGDIRNGISASKNKIDVVIHCASWVGGFLKNHRDEGQEKYELDLLLKVKEFMDKNGCDRIVYLSSIAVFERTQEYPHGPLITSNQVSPYAMAKRQGEEFVQNSFSSFVIIRPTNLFGREQLNHTEGWGVGSSHVIPELMAKIRKPGNLEILGDGTQIRNFLHVQDAALFVENILSVRQCAWYNLRSEIHITISELARELQAFCHTPKSVCFRPEFLAFEPVLLRKFDISEITRTGWQARVDTIADGLLF